ncbi:tyrosine-type recombinase/integrase [Prauserella muralis]|uniref:Integrase n=1 Tax=Prauserella muralis TaxID=588067 RepID=A0A2V4AEG7_9PSEU|nr:site-specific integrase [Prauserella muralis]PXY17028.1 integrase [Prauserella muralis]
MLRGLPPVEVLDRWLDDEDIPDRVPCLIAPDGRYDLALNRYFLQADMVDASEHTLAAIAYDLADFLTFLWCHRKPVGSRTWTDATPEDRAAYKRWRRTDPNGPRVAGSTWGRCVATVNQFYKWAVRRGLVEQNPVVQRPARSRPGRARSGQETPAEAPRDGRKAEAGWLPPASYRRWRDVGVRGYLPTGVRDGSFKGRLASRNATFCDLMVRTGLRLSEQSSLSLFEVPEVDLGRAYVPTRLPVAIAKGGSGRRIYIAASVLRDVWDYIRFDRAEVVERARERGIYDRVADPLVVEDPQRASLPPRRSGGRRVAVESLGHRERRRLFIRGEDGLLEPAALWLTEDGLPVMPGTWKSMFQDANDRCVRHGVALRCHPHLLRHSFAVVTLEQLQREHIRELARMSPAQRTSYEQVFGDPQDWVRRRLGHRSLESTFTYLHTLQELEMETRLALVPDEWEPAGLDSGELEREAADEAYAQAGLVVR